MAKKHGTFRPAAGDLSKWQLHQTFVIDRDHQMPWVSTGAKPVTDKITLIRELAIAKSLLVPSKQATRSNE